MRKIKKIHGFAAITMVAVWTLVFSAVPVMSAEALDASVASIEDQPYSTSSTSFSNVTGLSTSLNLSETGKVLVISTFSMDYGTGGSRTGQWRLSDGTNTSQTISRYIGGPNDRGIAMTVNLFDGSVGTNTYSLQTAAASGTSVTTSHGSIVAMSLTSQNSLSLDSSQVTQTSAITSSSTSFNSVASGTIDLTYGGHIFLTAAYNCNSGGSKEADRTGQWKLQVETSASNWVDVGTTAQRFMSSTSDTGASMLMGIYDASNLSAGSYNYRLVAATTVEDEAITTSNVTVTAMGLNFSGTEYLPHDQDAIASDTTTSNTLEPVDGLSTQITTETSSQIFVGSNFNIRSASATTINPATFGLDIENVGSTVVVDSPHLERTVSGTGDIGSGGIITLSDTTLDADTYNAYVEYATVSGNALEIANPNLVMVSLTSVPEPTTAGLLAIGGIVILRRKTRKRR